jgi:hypothetical protein
MKQLSRTTALGLAALFCLATSAAVAQQPAQSPPPASPPAKANATIGGQAITVDYSSPRMRGRKIMGGLVPYGQVWRTGANAATTLTTPVALTIGNLDVPAGKYTLFTIPGEKEWTLIVNKQTGQWGTRYDAAQDLGRVKMTVGALASPLEEMTIALRPGEGKKGTLAIEWESTSATVPITVH